jgi:hypothetical protein
MMLLTRYDGPSSSPGEHQQIDAGDILIADSVIACDSAERKKGPLPPTHR